LPQAGHASYPEPIWSQRSAGTFRPCTRWTPWARATASTGSAHRGGYWQQQPGCGRLLAVAGEAPWLRIGGTTGGAGAGLAMSSLFLEGLANSYSVAPALRK